MPTIPKCQHPKYIQHINIDREIKTYPENPLMPLLKFVLTVSLTTVCQQRIHIYITASPNQHK